MLEDVDRLMTSGAIRYSVRPSDCGKGASNQNSLFDEQTLESQRDDRKAQLLILGKVNHLGTPSLILFFNVFQIEISNVGYSLKG